MERKKEMSRQKRMKCKDRNEGEIYTEREKQKDKI